MQNAQNAANPLWVGAVIAGVAALSGVLVSVFSDHFKERRKIAHELRVREADRTAAAADRRRTFEIENLQAAYDGLWLLAREMAKVHLADDAVADGPHGYGGTQLPAGVERDLAATSQAAKAIRLILDDDVRALAHQAQESIGRVEMLGVTAKIHDRGPVSRAEGEAAYAAASTDVDRAMTAIADRLRGLMLDG